MEMWIFHRVFSGRVKKHWEAEGSRCASVFSVFSILNGSVGVAIIRTCPWTHQLLKMSGAVYFQK